MQTLSALGSSAFQLGNAITDLWKPLVSIADGISQLMGMFVK
ncbi:hypothetical protein [Corynebacterium sp. UBA2622]|nr:hypothetical protein [Corynebacterium sp. UBA2622]